MDILLLEDDLLVAELIELVLTGTITNVNVRHFTQVAPAKVAWLKRHAQLVICERHLADGSGLDLVKYIRSQDKIIPIVMISAHSNREAVISAVHYGISEFIAKPFDVNMLQQRLIPILQTIALSCGATTSLPAIETWLTQALTGKLQLPSALSPDSVLPLLTRTDELSPATLARLWHKETRLSARLLDVANSASLKRSGKPLGRLDEAISMLGVDMALCIAMALALDITGALTNELLIEHAQHHQAMAEQVASIAQAMAMSLELDGLSCYTAGLLSRAGELAVLRTLQDFINLGGALTPEQASALITYWAPRYGNRIKQQWGLPLPVRELIGAIHIPPTHTTQRTLLIMHLAGLRVSSQFDTPEALRMLRRSGLDPEKWRIKPAEDVDEHTAMLAKKHTINLRN